VAKRPSYYARHPADLESLSVLPLKRKRGIGQVVIADADLPIDKREGSQREINRALRACGCAESSVGLMAGLFGFAGYALWRWLQGFPFGWRHLGWALLAMFAGALLGKLAGLVAAERRYRVLVHRIGREWPAEPPKTREVLDCG
jgi:hypothetical protein